MRLPSTRSGWWQPGGPDETFSPELSGEICQLIRDLFTDLPSGEDGGSTPWPPAPDTTSK